MATVAPTTAGRIDVVEWGDNESQETRPAAADITAGTFVRADTNGNWVLALATTAPNAAGARLALRTVKSGQALTAMRRGVVGGFTVSQAFGAALYLSDTGTLADAAGTVSVQVGRVVAGNANLATAAHDKLVKIDCPL
jgi:predicted RecA/RadA family phage recombinase